LGDSATISPLLDPQGHTDVFDAVAAPRIGADMKYVPVAAARKIRFYRHIDGRFILEDLFAKLQLSFGRQQP
jgi:hypothetical protein